MLALILLSGSLSAQEAIRGSLTGYTAAAARVGSIKDMDYNLLLGPVRIKLTSALDLEANDNINLADDASTTVKKFSDFVIRPRVDVIGAWQVTQLNRIDLKLGLGIERHVNHPEYDSSTLIVAPSEINFDLFIHNIKLSLHDRFSLQQDPLSDPTVNNSSGRSYLSNTFGLVAMADLNKIIVSLGYDHTDLVAFGDNMNESNNRHSELLYGSLGFPMDTTTAGLQASLAITSYDLLLQPDLTVVSIGPYVQALLTPYTRFEFSGGLQYTSFQANDRSSISFGASSAEAEKDNAASAPGFHFTATLSNRLNSSFSHTLSFGHERELAFGANYVDRNFVNYSANWHMTQSINLSTVIFFENGSAFAGAGSTEKFDRIGFGLSFAYRLTQHLFVAFRYNYTQKTSDLVFRNYVQNVIGVTFSYDF